MGIDQFYLSDFREVMFGEDTPYFEEKTDGKEYVYESGLGYIENINIVIKVYSSVRTDTEQARSSDEDSIKVKLETEDGNIIALDGEKYKRLTRQHGWEDRLKQYITFLRKAYPDIIKECNKCGRPMLLKKKKGSWFAGCSGWSPNDPDCQNTQDI